MTNMNLPAPTDIEIVAAELGALKECPLLKAGFVKLVAANLQTGVITLSDTENPYKIPEAWNVAKKAIELHCANCPRKILHDPVAEDIPQRGYSDTFYPTVNIQIK